MTETDRRTLWGDLFEVAVKRGCLALLQERGLLRFQQEHLRDWRTMRVHALHRHLVEQSGAIDPGERSVLASSLDHLLIAGWGLGWTVMREYLRRFTEGIEVLALWCPLSLPDRCRSSDSDPPPRTRQVETLWRALGLSGQPDLAWANRGEPANADLLFLLRAGGRCHVLCLEFSLHAPPEAEDFSGESAHLGEVERFIQRLESRGVFTRIAAEITGERFTFSDALVSHLTALTTHDKPLYKLVQGSSYATRLLHWLEQHGEPLVPATAQVIAVTSAGIEALCATFGTGTDPRAGLMTALGDAYRKLDGVPADDAVLIREIQAVRHQIARSLPATLREPFVEAFASPPASREIDVRLHEGLTGYVNPARKMPMHQALSWVADAPEAVAAQLGGPPVERIAAALGRQPDGGRDVSLRDLHAAALHAGLSAARPGQITVIAAEGHPGIGKTTAVLDHLRRMPPDEGYLFLYVSPRIVINTDVTQKVARDADGTHAGVLTLTTNARLIRGARRWHESQGTTGEQTERRFV
ncbi:MAG TPA: helicase, partial [Chloroflexota bacterium]|nr:helicase [Chloroflexota bacterium]